MNVLIVDQDKSFSESMCGFLEEYKEDYCIDVCNSISKLEKILKEEDISYDIGFVDYDFVGNEFNKINKKNPDCKLIGLTSSDKNLSLIINMPVFQRIFHKPVSISDISNYLKKQGGVFSINSINSYKSAIRLLKELGFEVSQIGTIYLGHVIYNAVTKKIRKLKDLYTIVSNEMDVEYQAINWSINYAVDRANDGIKSEKLMEFFCLNENRKVTPKVIIDFFVNQST